MWPLENYWNDGEYSGWVGRCPGKEGQRCLGGRWSECSKGFLGEFCSLCDKEYYIESGYCLACDAQNTAAMASLNSGFLTVSALFLFIAPHYVLVWAFKCALAVGSLLGIVGGLGDAQVSKLLHQIWSAMTVFNVDISFRKPGCDGTSSEFIQVFWANLDLMCRYLLPIGGLLGVCILVRLVGICGVTKKFSQNAGEVVQARLICGLAMVIEMMWYRLMKISLEALICTPSAEGGTWRLYTHPAVRCLKEDHVAAFSMAAVLIAFVGLGFPALTMYVVMHQHKADRLHTTFNLKSLGFMHLPFKGKFKTRCMTFTFFARFAVACQDFAGNSCGKACLNRCLNACLNACLKECLRHSQ